MGDRQLRTNEPEIPEISYSAYSEFQLAEWTYLEEEPSAKVPSDHHPLCFTPLDFLLPLNDSCIESQDHTLLDLVDDLRPGRGIVPAFSRQVDLDTSTDQYIHLEMKMSLTYPSCRY
jgi:hypothetical protein